MSLILIRVKLFYVSGHDVLYTNLILASIARIRRRDVPYTSLILAHVARGSSDPLDTSLISAMHKSHSDSCRTPQPFLAFATGDVPAVPYTNLILVRVAPT